VAVGTVGDFWVLLRYRFTSPSILSGHLALHFDCDGVSAREDAQSILHRIGLVF
jgi:hypothetical protein